MNDDDCTCFWFIAFVIVLALLAWSYVSFHECVTLNSEILNTTETCVDLLEECTVFNNEILNTTEACINSLEECVGMIE